MSNINQGEAAQEVTTVPVEIEDLDMLANWDSVGNTVTAEASRGFSLSGLR